MTDVTSWTIEGADGEPIPGDTHRPAGDAAGVIVIAHGFKGYKDYGMFPRVAARLAEAGFLAHRFNFSHSGMTNNIETFERPDLFERDTWNRQVDDLKAVVNAIHDGRIEGSGHPFILFGHSRGGATVLLAAGRAANDASFPAPAGIATAAAPDTLNRLSDDEERQLMERGYLESPSSRTGQILRIGREWLEEMRADPKGHDLANLVPRITAPILIIHGENDPTVPVECAERLAVMASSAVKIVRIGGEHADHVFNTPNPLPDDQPEGPELARLISELTDFARDCCGAAT